MKNCLLIFVTFLFPGWAFSQCTPSSNSIPGVTPDIATNLPIAYTGIYYSEVLQVRTPLDTTINGTYAKLISVQINGISNLPAGFSYVCAPTNCTLGPLSNGCLLITGNPTLAQAGTYLLDINATISVKLYGVIPVTQQTKISDYKIKIAGPPVAKFYLDKYNSCAGDSVQMENKSANYPTNYLWTFNGGNPSTSTLKNPAVKYSTPGTYTIKLKASSPNGKNTLTKTSILHVIGMPTAALTSYLSDTICNGDSTRISAIQGNNLTYNWYKNGSLISGSSLYYYYAKTTGNYHVKVTNSQVGCEAVSPDKFINRVVLSLSVTPPNGLTTCFPNNIDLIATPNNNYSYKWFKGNQLINGVTTNIFSANVSGAYKVQVTNKRGCTRISTVQSVSINPKPGATFTAQGPTTFCNGQSVNLVANTPGNGGTYQWYRNKASISGATNYKYLATQRGWYTVKVGNSYGCFATSTKLKLTVNCRLSYPGTNELTFLNAVVSPNPSSSSAILAFETAEPGAITIEIYDALGKMNEMLANNFFEAGEHELFIHSENYTPGIYLVRITSTREQKILRLVVQ